MFLTRIRMMSARKKAICTLNMIALLDLMAVSLFLPLINREIKQMGGSPFIMGLVTSVYGAIQLLSSPLFGRGADIYGRKYTLVISILAASIGCILLGIASSLILVLFSRIIAGFFKHTQTLAKVILTDLAPDEKSYFLGNYNAFGSMGFIIGPTIGGHLVQTENGFRNVCCLAGFIFVINAVLIFFMVPETLKKKSHKDSNLNLNKTKGCDEKEKSPDENGEMTTFLILALLALRFLFSFATLVPRANLLLILEAKYQASVVSVGYLNSLQAVVATLTGFLVGPVIGKIYREDNRRMVIHCSIAQSISLFGLFFSPTLQIAGLCLMLLSASNPFLRVGITTLSLGDSKDHGAILGLGQTATSLARMLCPITAGIAQEWFSDDGPALLGALSAFLGVLCIILCVPKQSSSTPYVKHKIS